MIRFRLWNAAMLAWLFLLFNVERIHEPINLASFVYALCAVVAMITVAAPMLLYESRALLVATIFAAYFGIKVALGYSLAGSGLPYTVTEICAVGVTLLLARKIAWDVLRFEEAAVNVLTADLSGRALPFEKGQGEMYREVRRARLFDRPLTLLSLTPLHGANQRATSRIVEQMQREWTTKYVDALLADVLAKETNDCDVISYTGDRFVVLLTEADAGRAEAMVQQLRQVVKEKLDLELQVGTAVFPNEELTFSGLLERAESQMDEPEPAVEAFEHRPDVLEHAHS